MYLKGKTVVITRPKHQAEDLAKIVEKLGGVSRLAPTVEIGNVPNNDKVKEPLNSIAKGKADMIIFMSQNGVTSFFSLVEMNSLKSKIIRAMEKMTVIAIGSKTKKKVEDQGIKVDVTPTDHSSIGLAKELSGLDLENKTIAIPRTDKATDYLNEKLKDSNAQLLQFTTYETRIPADPSEILVLIDDIINRKIDIITFTSSATAYNLFNIAKENKLSEKLRISLNENVVVASIGPVTKKTLEDFGVIVRIMPQEYTIESMMEELEKHFSEKNGHIEDSDIRLLDLLQEDIPLVSRPWDTVGRTLGLSGQEVLEKLNRLKENGVIRKVGPIIDAKKVGFKASTLVGMKVPNERIDEVAGIINSYNEVSHNYERNHKYNIWFTLSTENQDELNRIYGEISSRTGISENDILNLQTKRFFKIMVKVKLGNESK
jgi:uroporphyrinogen-III synthase